MAFSLTRRLISKRVGNICEYLVVSSYPYSNFALNQRLPSKFIHCEYKKITLPYPGTSICSKQFMTTSKLNDKNHNEQDTQIKLTLFQKFKQMYRDYWYVLVPVHLVTSAVWFGSFYYMAKSGVDIVALLESWHISEKLVNPLKDSSMGYIALAYAMYKVATPLRYTVTLGGTTISINYLKKWGYIKPVPSTERMKEIYKEKKDHLVESLNEKKEGIKETREQLIKSVSQKTEQLKKKNINIKDKITEVKEKT